MSNKLEIRQGVFYLNGANFVDDVLCELDNKPNDRMNAHIGPKIEDIVEEISVYRKQGKDDLAIRFSDSFFESFTPLMNIFAKEKKFYQNNLMWGWVIHKVKKIEEQKGIKFGEGVHKGTAFYFYGLSKLMMADVDGAYLAFAEAAEEDKILPVKVRDHHLKRLTPIEKILLLDLSKDNFAYESIQTIREYIDRMECSHPSICRDTPIFKSLQNAIENDSIPQESAIHLCHAFIKAFVLDTWRRDFGRPTPITISLLGDNILRFARTLEDFIRDSNDINGRLSPFCNSTWFPSEKWDGIKKRYDDNISNLIDDFINDEWGFSKDGRNLFFTIKIRNGLAHRIPFDEKIFDYYLEIILAISSSFGFICEKAPKGAHGALRSESIS